MAEARVLNWPVEGLGETPTFGRYIAVRPTKRQLRDAMELGILSVKDDEQRGFDPVSGREMLNEAKMKRWAEYETKGELFIGQLNFALHTELGTTWDLSPDGKTVRITGPVLIADGRQRSYTVRHAVDQAEQYGIENYDVNTPVEVTVWLDAESDTRKEIYAQLNGGRGGDHASKSSVEWMAPEGPLQEAAKYLVQTSPHLGFDNVNIQRDAVTRNDPRIAGFHTFVKALEDAWGYPKRRLPTPAETEDLKKYLVRFYAKLVEVRPEMGRADLGTRQKSRDELITGHPLFLYGALRVALDLYFAHKGEPDLSVLEVFNGAKGDEFFSIDNQDWIDCGVRLPSFDTKTQKINGYKVTNTLQSRRAMSQMMLDRFKTMSGSTSS
jgi:hypothetical protein